ncbi:Gfo/Idh/MocA family oxidoreductase [Actinosynnema sp. NPDC020468]|uniref:Gfo/Idh/MocA family oxidoreductase n=1 Tax=Actinosynnema sp. NPDC020468 TaxID=3154488 RepID=UPI00340F2D1A
MTRVLVCGTKFGRAYLAGVRPPLVLAGILAAGGERSRRCAARYGVPLWTDVAQVSAVDIACVVVGAGINSGPGARLAQALLARGVPVLQEHPLGERELVETLRAARGVPYAVNTHYPHVEPVRRFVDRARALLRRQRALYVDAVCAFQVAYTMFDLLGLVLGGLRPWRLAAVDAPGDHPYRCLQGEIAGVPVTVRVQPELDARVPDNHAHTYHRVTLGTEGGHLTLATTHGPVLWSPRPHLPAGAEAATGYDEVTAPHLTEPVTSLIGPPAPTYREVLDVLWPDATHAAMVEFARAVAAGTDLRGAAQHHLALCRITAEAVALAGGVRLTSRPDPEILSAREVAALP